VPARGADRHGRAGTSGTGRRRSRARRWNLAAVPLFAALALVGLVPLFYYRNLDRRSD